MKRWIIILCGLAAAGAAVWYYYRGSTENSEQVSYKTSEIKFGSLENITSSTGTLSAVSTVDVGSQVSGTLKTVRVDFNDRVTKGQILAELDTLLLDAAVRDADANLLKAKAQYAQAKVELERNRSLYEKGYLSESEFLTYSTDLDVKAAAVSSAESSLFKAKTNLSYGVIRSPIDGIVIQRSVDPGQTIAASLQTPQLFIIAEDLSNMKIEVSVDESDIGSIKEGMPARFEVQAYPDMQFSGIVKQVRLQPETVSNVVNYTVIVNASNPDGRLLPGMTATVDFIVDKVDEAILVPNSAINFRPDKDLIQQLRDRRGNAENSNSATSHQNGGKSYNRETGSADRQKDVSRIFILEPSGNVSSLVFKPGVTDGTYTEVRQVLSGPERLAGMQAITSSNADKTASRRSMLPLGGPPPGGAGMRRSGL